MSLQDLVNLALAERRDANYRRARADRLLAAVIGEAERLRAAGVSVRELDSDQRIGTLRLDGANLPAAPVIDKPDELASWLAERFPDLRLVDASIKVPVGRLGEVLDLLDMAGLRDVADAKVEPRDLGKTLSWLGEHCRVQADPEIPHAWNVLHVDGDGHVEPVPGTTARTPTPIWKVLVDKALQADAVAVAQAEIDGLVRELRERDAAEQGAADPSRDADGYTVGPRPRWHPSDDDVERVATPEIEAERIAADRRRAARLADEHPKSHDSDEGRDPADKRDADAAEYARLPRAELARLCRDRTLLVSGTKAELVDRLIVADRNATRPGWTARV